MRVCMHVCVHVHIPIGVYTNVPIVYVCIYIMYMYTLSAGLFYFTLGNVPPKYRSCLQAIQLLQVVKVPYIQLYGMDAVLFWIIEDLKILEQVCKYMHFCVNVHHIMHIISMHVWLFSGYPNLCTFIFAFIGGHTGW